jgi:hypothetical protein
MMTFLLICLVLFLLFRPRRRVVTLPPEIIVKHYVLHYHITR